MDEVLFFVHTSADVRRTVFVLLVAFYADLLLMSDERGAICLLLQQFD